MGKSHAFTSWLEKVNAVTDGKTNTREKYKNGFWEEESWRDLERIDAHGVTTARGENALRRKSKGVLFCFCWIETRWIEKEPSVGVRGFFSFFGLTHGK